MKGQAILALILIMAVALAIGVSVIQKSLVDVSTSTKVEQSQRAFSAAEAGIEKALREKISGGITLENQSSANFDTSALLPLIPGAVGCTSGCGQQEVLEYPPISKEEFAHIWLADPEVSLPNCSSADKCYKGTSLDVYWGDHTQTTDKAAIQVKIVYYDTSISSYKVLAYYFDPDTTRATSSGFSPASSCSSVGHELTILGNIRKFYCKQTISSLPANLMLLRARLLYNSISQPFAVQAVGTCGKDCSLPPQARIIVSEGLSGETQRILQVFQIDKVVPPYFDFAIFSAGEIKKSAGEIKK